MNQNHRYFVQYMLKKGIATVDDALDYCKYISKGEINVLQNLQMLVTEINRNISKQYFKLIFKTCEVTEQDVIIWLNTKSDEISKLQITSSNVELEYFQAILEEILSSEDFQITCIVCVNLTSTLTMPFPRDSGQKILDKWLTNGYFTIKNSCIYLGPRLISEFTSYLKTRSNAICSLCSELVFMGKRCKFCNKTLHSYCLSKYLEGQDHCPCCYTTWEE